MSEMKIGSTDPKVLATVIIVNHGTSLTQTEVDDVVYEAVGETQWEVVDEDLISQVWNLIQDAEVTIRWPDEGSCHICQSQYPSDL